jgi:hypothetical protein
MKPSRSDIDMEALSIGNPEILAVLRPAAGRVT